MARQSDDQATEDTESDSGSGTSAKKKTEQKPKRHNLKKVKKAAGKVVEASNKLGKKKGNAKTGKRRMERSENPSGL